jgi:hypothetical protein
LKMERLVEVQQNVKPFSRRTFRKSLSSYLQQSFQL